MYSKLAAAPEKSRRSWKNILTAGLLLAGAAAIAWAAPSVLPEYQVKAAFLLNFARFVEWPAASSAPEQPFTIGILGRDPFGPHLDQIVDAKNTAERRVTVRRFEDWNDGRCLEALHSCQLLFISQSEKGSMETIMAGMKGRPVLTVSDSAGFIEQGGVIELVVQAKNVRFLINQEAARQAGLKISAKLMKLAGLRKE